MSDSDNLKLLYEQLASFERDLIVHGNDPQRKFQLETLLKETKEKIAELEGRERPDRQPDPPWKANPYPPSKLPRTGEHLIGRSKELATLTRAWKNPKTSIRWPGSGSSTRRTGLKPTLQ